MSNLIGSLRIVCAAPAVAASVQPAYAMGGGGPPVWTMTLNYCRETVANKGITDVAQFEAEVKKCRANPVTDSPAYDKPRW
jgi:hypothetical protein